MHKDTFKRNLETNFDIYLYSDIIRKSLFHKTVLHTFIIIFINSFIYSIHLLDLSIYLYDPLFFLSLLVHIFYLFVIILFIRYCFLY